MKPEVFYITEENKDSPEGVAVRMLISLELTRLAPVMEMFLGEDMMDHLIILLSALSPTAPLPRLLLNRLIAKGYIHEGGELEVQPEQTHAAPTTTQ